MHDHSDATPPAGADSGATGNSGASKPEVTPASGLRSLLDHATDKALAARARHGPDIGHDELEAILQDASVTRYPTQIVFSADGLDAGMFAAAIQVGERPSDGFAIHVHPHFEDRPEDLPLLVAYHLVAVNYGEIADPSVAEQFGAALLGLAPDAYYERLCTLADELD